MEITGEAFRRVLGHLPTGVTVITTNGSDGSPVGMAANSVTSVSLEPPLVLFCPAKSSTTWPSIREVGMFCINIMADHHGEVSRRFSLKGVDRFAGIAHEPGPCGPILKDAVGWIDCAIRDEHEAGDHTIVVASVTRIEAAPDTAPLVFFRGVYGTFRAAVELPPIAPGQDPRGARRR